MRILSPLTGEPTNHPIATVDIETWGLDANESGDSFALGVWWDGHTSKTFTDISDFRSFLASGATRGYYVFAHNGGRYDYISIFGNYLRQNPNALIMSKNKFIALKVRENRHADRVMISSTKSMHGHLIGGTGAVELLACILALREGVIAPTIGYQEPDPECALDVVPNVAREAKVDAVLSNAFAFGGLNAVIALRRV